MKFNPIKIIILLSLFIVSCNTDSRTTNNVESFSLLYGYARWFHPSDEAQLIDWDKFAVLGVEKVKEAKNTDELETILLDLFQPFIVGLEIKKKEESFDFDLTKLTPKDYTKEHYNIVCWQHYGGEISNESNIYTSVRTSRLKEEEASFLSKYLIDIDSINNNLIKVSGYFKTTKIVSGKADFFLSTLSEKELEELDNPFLQNSVEITNDSWKKFELIDSVKNDSKSIMFGLLVEGEIDLVTDNIELSIFKNGKWKTLDSTNMGFEKDVFNLKVNFAPKKWCHGQFSHDFTIDKEDYYEGKQALSIKYTGKRFKATPSIGECIQKDIKNGLKCSIPLALYSTNEHTYPAKEKKDLEKLIQEIEAVDFKQKEEVIVNMASVLIMWNVIEHFFPYFNELDLDWDKELNNALQQTLKCDPKASGSKSDFYLVLSALLAKLKDGHGSVEELSCFTIPARVDIIENKFIITATKTDQLKIGDEIIEIDGKTSTAIFDDLNKYAHGSTHLAKYRTLKFFGKSFERGTAELLIKRGNSEKEIIVEKERTWFYNRILKDPFFMDTSIYEIEPNIYYVNLRNMTDEIFAAYDTILANAKSVIYDDRRAGGMSLLDIIPHWIKQPVNSPVWLVPEIIYPNQKEMRFDTSYWSVYPKAPFFTSKRIILTNATIMSSGETAMSIIKHNNLAVLVGEKTGGCNGNINIFKVPSGYTVKFTGMKVEKMNGDQLYLEGFSPDYPVIKTIKALKEGRDEVLEKALEVARE